MLFIISCTWVFSALPEPTTACLIWRGRVLEHARRCESAVPQIAAPRAWPSFSALSAIAIDEHPLDGDLLGPVLRRRSLHAAEDLAQPRREIALAACGSRRSPRRSAAVLRHPTRRSRCTANPDRCQHAHCRARRSGSLPCQYDTGQWALKPTGDDGANHGNHRIHPRHGELADSSQPARAVRALDLPAAARALRATPRSKSPRSCARSTPTMTW